MSQLTRASFRVAVLAALSFAMAACSGGGPDTSEAKTKLLTSVNLQVMDLAKWAEFRETTRKSTNDNGMQSFELEYEGELEFTGDCNYNGKDRKSGDRQKVYGMVEYVKDGDVWKQLGMSMHSR